MAAGEGVGVDVRGDRDVGVGEALADDVQVGLQHDGGLEVAGTAHRHAFSDLGVDGHL